MKQNSNGFTLMEMLIVIAIIAILIAIAIPVFDHSSKEAGRPQTLQMYDLLMRRYPPRHNSEIQRPL